MRGQMGSVWKVECEAATVSKVWCRNAICATDGTLGMSDLRGTESEPGNSWAFRGSARDDAVVLSWTVSVTPRGIR